MPYGTSYTYEVFFSADDVQGVNEADLEAVPQALAWPEVPLPAGTHALRMELSLLGDIRLEACAGADRHRLYSDHDAAPWKIGDAKYPGWLPKSTGGPADLPTWDWPNDGPG